MVLLAAFMLFSSVGAFASFKKAKPNKRQQLIEKKAPEDNWTCKTAFVNISCRSSKISITVCCQGCDNLTMFFIALAAWDQTETQQCGTESSLVF